MLQGSNSGMAPGGRYALCVGIGTYTNLSNRNLRYAANDAVTIAKQLTDPQRGNFVVTVLTEPAQTSKAALDEALDELLNAPDRKAEDLVLIYFSCHGDLLRPDDTFCLLPSNATLQNDATFKKTTVLGIFDFTKLLSGARARNIIVLLDVCHSGGAGVALQHLRLDLPSGPNLFIIGAARQDQIAMQSSQLRHGIFTHCLLRAFEQPPTKDGWLTISQIHIFVSDDIQWFTKEHPVQIQGWSVSVNPNLALVRNPGYSELCPLPPLWTVPLQRNRFFTGQEDVLSQLASILQSDQKTALTQPQAIAGLGGIGKTQLAIEYAYRYRQNYHAVLWVHADMREELISSFVSIAHLLDLPEKDEQDQTVIVGAVKAWLAGRSNWLLILDNADELAMVKELIPPAFRGHLLLTTRAQVMGGVAYKLEVKVMQPETGALFLLRRVGLLARNAPLEQAAPADVTIAKELSEEMGGLPLALDQAGAYIEAVSCSLQDYQRLYQTHRAELLKERGGVVPDHPESVATTWSLAFQKVEQGSSAASDLLRLCAFLHPDAIPEEIITKGAKHLGPQLQAAASDPLALDKAITALRAYSLLHRDSATHMLTIHRLVQAVLKESMDEQIRREWAERAVGAVNAAFPTVEYKNWSGCERLLPQALMCWDLIKQHHFFSGEAPALLHQAGYYLLHRARYTEAEPLLQGALTIREQQLGPDHLETVKSINSLAELYRLQGEYSLAEQFFRQALSARERILGREHLEVAESLDGLAWCYYDQRQFQPAENLFRQALMIRKQILGKEHPDVVATMNALGLVCRDQHKDTQAEVLFQEALEISKKVFEPEHPELAYCYNNLATIYTKRGKYTEAEPLFEQAIAIREKKLGHDHPDLADSLMDYANCLSASGDINKSAQAESLYQRSLTIFEQAAGHDHPYVAIALTNLARLYEHQDKYKEAEPLYQQALAIREHHLGPNHPDTAQSLQSLANLYQYWDRYEEAEPLYRRALAINEQALGVNHRFVADTLNDFANLYFEQGQDEHAKEFYQRALSIYEQHLDPTSLLNMVISLNNLANLYKKQGQYTQAERLYQRALTIGEQQLGPEHLRTAWSLNNLAELYYTQGQYAQAEPLYQRALAIKKKQLGPEHPETATSLNDLAKLYLAQGKYHESELLLKRALTIYEHILGPEHPHTVTIRDIYHTLIEHMQRKGKSNLPLSQ